MNKFIVQYLRVCLFSTFFTLSLAHIKSLISILSFNIHHYVFTANTNVVIWFCWIVCACISMQTFFEQCVRSYASNWLSQILAVYQSDYISSYIFRWNNYHKIQYNPKLKRMNYNCWYSFLHLHIRIAYNV